MRRYVTPQAIDWASLVDELADPDRALPGGVSVGELAGEEFDQLAASIGAALTAARASDLRDGHEYAMTWSAIHGALAWKGWFGSPRWLHIVDAFMEALEDRASAAWR